MSPQELLPEALRQLDVFHACDIDSSCRQWLKCHSPCTRPRHVFADLLGRYSTLTQARLQEAVNTARAQLEPRQAQGSQMDELGVELLDHLLAILDESTMVGGAHERDFCEVHHTACPVWDLRPRPGGLVLNCSGSTCWDFSSLGKARRTFGPTIVPFACWLHERKRMAARGEDGFVHECTRLHPSMQLLGRAFTADTHVMWSFVLSPRDLGVPYSRPRRLCICMGKWPVPLPSPWLACVPARDPGPELLLLFGCSPLLRGMDLFLAEPHEVEQYRKDRCRLARRHPSTPFRHLLSSSVQQRLQQYEDLASPEERDTLIVSLQQKPQFFGKGTKHMPCLTTKSVQWSHKLQRWTLPLEALAASGWPPRRFASISSFASPVDLEGRAGVAFSEKHVIKKAGNGIHLQVGGVVLLWVMSTFAAPLAQPPSTVDAADTPRPGKLRAALEAAKQRSGPATLEGLLHMFLTRC